MLTYADVRSLAGAYAVAVILLLTYADVCSPAGAYAVAVILAIATAVFLVVVLAMARCSCFTRFTRCYSKTSMLRRMRMLLYSGSIRQHTSAYALLLAMARCSLYSLYSLLLALLVAVRLSQGAMLTDADGC